MPRFTLNNVQWCSDHGHPFAVLGTEDHKHHLVVAIAVEEAQMLAVHPQQSIGIRVHGLLATLMRFLDVHLESVELILDDNLILQSRIHLMREGERLHVQAAFVDGIAIAEWGAAPLWMTDYNLARAPRPDESHAPQPHYHGTLPSAFRDLIDSLDLQGLDPEA
ncbi:MAG TPA: bifunctional nuclease domain-containing protein [Thermomicrobiales bacterium]|nr:bifunctional nuclease domain-containing protein [Thermomicrobiales bacterium]